MHDSALRHYLEPRQLRIFFETAFLINSRECVWRLPDEPNSDILHELVNKRQREPYINLQELKKAVRQKWNEIDDQTIKKAILQCLRFLAAVTKQDGEQSPSTSVESLLRLENKVRAHQSKAC